MKQYNRAVLIATEEGDNGSRDLLVQLLKDEEGHVDWLEAQVHQIKELGYERYLTQQMGEDDESSPLGDLCATLCQVFPLTVYCHQPASLDQTGLIILVADCEDFHACYFARNPSLVSSAGPQASLGAFARRNTGEPRRRLGREQVTNSGVTECSPL